MKQFNINDYQGKYAMHCKTEEEAKDFCRVMHEAGRTWSNRMSYLSETYWQTLEGNTAYAFNESVCDDIKLWKEENYTILNWSDFMQHEFTKANLRDGMVGIDRVGRKYIYLNGQFMENIGNSRLCPPGYLNEDLTIDQDQGCDIMRICTSKARVLNKYFDDENLATIWQRPEATVMTMDEIKKALGIEGELIIKEV